MADVDVTESDSQFFKATLSFRGKIRLASEIKKKLSNRQKKLFDETVFGPWLNVRYTEGDPCLVSIVLQTQVTENPVVPDELLFRVGNQDIRFRRQEFCLMTGLRFGSVSLDKAGAHILGIPIRDRLFRDISRNNSVKISNLLKMYNGGFKKMDDLDAVRICLLLLLLVGFEGKHGDAVVDDAILKLVEDFAAWNVFPWGSYLWAETFPQLETASAKIRDSPHSLRGFIWAFKMWIVEAFPNARQFADKKGFEDVIPRAIAWNKKGATTWKGCLRFIRVDNINDIPHSTLTPTDAEANTDWWRDSMRFFDGTDTDVEGMGTDTDMEGMGTDTDMEGMGPTNDMEGMGPTNDSMLHRVLALEDMASQRDARVASLEDSLSARDDLIASLQRSVLALQESVHTRVVALEDMASHRDARIASLEESVSCRDDLIASLQISVLALQELVRPFPDRDVTVGEPPRPPPSSTDVSLDESQNRPIPISWPAGGVLTLDWVKTLMSTFDWSSKNFLPAELPTVLSKRVIDELVLTASKILHKEANCVVVEADHVVGSSVVVVGDLHGQLHDLLFLLKDAGYPHEEKFYVFNGDYVDRGAWGLETFLILLVWKVFLPHRVFLLRGNHETSYCTITNGFRNEVLAKYGDVAGNQVYLNCLSCFKELPLASIIAGRAYTAHGGIFRKTPDTVQKQVKGKTKCKVKPNSEPVSLSLGSLEDLRKASRRVLDPSFGDGSLIAGDVLWSDPKMEAGLSLNVERGPGLLWGPDCTEEFLKTSGLKLIIRSHEGPDVRDGRAGFGGMDEGYTIDHVVPSGKLITVFSAPDYPQFQATHERYNNKGAYIVLESPNFDTPVFHSFDAVTPRPTVKPYYDCEGVPDSDAEIDVTKGVEDSDAEIDVTKGVEDVHL